MEDNKKIIELSMKVSAYSDLLADCNGSFVQIGKLLQSYDGSFEDFSHYTWWQSVVLKVPKSVYNILLMV